MTLLDQSWAVQVPGTPAPKGSMLMRWIPKGGRTIHCRKCGTGIDAGRHILIEDNKGTKPWRKKVADAGTLIRDKAGGTIKEGAVGVEVTFTLPRPASVPLIKRIWPWVRGSTDVDKLARCVLDGLQDAAVFADDSQVCELTARKAYPDTPGCPDRLDHPGAVIRLYPL